MVSVVFICTGNVCRSPMAEAILCEEWGKQKRDNLIVTSMGIHGLDKQQPSQFAIDVCKENDIDITSHRSRKLVIPELESADLILSMELVHKKIIQLFFLKFNDKSFLLGAWPEKESRKSNIKDPMGGSLKTYRQVYKIIAGHIKRIIPAIEEFYC